MLEPHYRYAKGLFEHSPIVLRPVPDDSWVRKRKGYDIDSKPQLMELVDDVCLSFVYDRLTWEVNIRAGYIFDGASIPQFAWSLVGSPWDAKILAAALVHDALYAAHPVDRARPNYIISRDVADDVLYTLCKYLGMGYIKRNIIYIAVDTAGGEAWRKTEPYTVLDARAYIAVALH